MRRSTFFFTSLGDDPADADLIPHEAELRGAP
jgi:hypothetical protein